MVRKVCPQRAGDGERAAHHDSVDAAHVDDGAADAGSDHVPRRSLPGLQEAGDRRRRELSGSVSNHGAGPRLLAAHQEDSLQVDPDHRVKVLLAHLEKGRRLDDPRVGHRDVQAAQPLGRGAHRALHLRLVADVADQARGGDALGPQLLLCGRQRGGVNVGQRDAAPGAAEGQRARVAYACAAGGW